MNTQQDKPQASRRKFLTGAAAAAAAPQRSASR